MFVIVFRPGPRGEKEFTPNINSYGHAPLLFLSLEAKTSKPFWAEHFENAKIFRRYDEALSHCEKPEQLAREALMKMYNALMPLMPGPKIEGVIAIMPLAFGKAESVDHFEAV